MLSHPSEFAGAQVRQFVLRDCVPVSEFGFLLSVEAEAIFRALNRRDQIVNQCSFEHPSSPCVNSHLQNNPCVGWARSPTFTFRSVAALSLLALLNSFHTPQFRAAGPWIGSDL